jgi:hypothetical protein
MEPLGFQNIPNGTWTGLGFTSKPPYGNLGRVGISTRGLTKTGLTAGTSTDLSISQPHIIASIAYTAAADAFNSAPYIDLTDQSGHGIIFCGQKIHLAIGPTVANSTTAVQFDAKILFRWKNVSLTEYIGVVTSQLAA